MGKSSTIRVAIIGGGLAGTILMNALMKYSQLDVQIYEANSEIKERGASIGLSRNARRALRFLGMGDIVKKAGGVRVGSSYVIMGEGPEAGTVIRDRDWETETVHRAALLKELLAPIPQDHINLNKRLLSIEEDGITLKFEDGTSTVADVIIGADGIKSGVRRRILGAENSNLGPVSAGFWDVRALVSFDEGVAKLGDKCFNSADPRQHMHIGTKGVVFHDIIDDARTVCIVLSGPIPSEWNHSSEWKYTISRKWLEEQYANWGEYGRNAIDLACGDKDEVSAFIQWESAKTDTVHNQTMCMIGDAAHATTPWVGSGISEAIEDSLILEKVLGRCNNTEQVPAAFEAYDRVRREHAQKVIDSSRRTAEMYFSSDGLNIPLLKTDLPPRDYILDWDTEGAINEAIQIFDRLSAVDRQ